MHSALSAGWRRYNHELLIIPTWDPVKSPYRGCQSQQLLCTLEFIFPNQVLRVSYYHLYMWHCGIVREEPGPSIQTIFTLDFSLVTRWRLQVFTLHGFLVLKPSCRPQLFELPHGNLGKPWGPKGIPKILMFIPRMHLKVVLLVARCWGCRASWVSNQLPG